MRIGYMYDLQAHPPRGGNHRHVYELAQGFLERGLSVSVVGDPSMPGVKNYSTDKHSLTEFSRGIDVLYVRIDGRPVRAWQALHQCLELLQQQPMVWEINAPANENLAFSWLGGEYSEEEAWTRRLRRWAHASRKKPFIAAEERVRRRLARRVVSAICVSSALARYARLDLRIGRTLTLPNGGPLISEQEIIERRRQREARSFTVLYCGSPIYPWQGLNYLLGAIRLASQRGLEMTFVLAVNQRTAGLPEGRNVVIYEGLDQQRLRDVICCSDVAVALHPEYFWSRWGFHGSPMKLFEYMACETASLTSDIGQMREILRHREDVILCKNDPEEILANLELLREDPRLRERVARGGWLRVQKELNWGRNVEATIDVLRQATTHAT